MFTYNFDDLALVGMVADEDGVYPIEKTLTLEEKKEYLDSINPHTADLVADFEALREALKDENVIKRNKYGTINISSFNAFVKRSKNLHYGPIRNRRWGSGDEPYYRLDGVQHLFGSYEISRHLDYISNYEGRFHNYIAEQIKSESKKAESIANNNYEVENRERIQLGKKAEEIIDNFRVLVPYAVTEVDRWNDGDITYKATTSDACYGSCYRNGFGRNSHNELTKEGKVLEQEKVEQLVNLFLKYGKKISVLLDDLNDDIREVLGD